MHERATPATVAVAQTRSGGPHAQVGQSSGAPGISQLTVAAPTVEVSVVIPTYQRPESLLACLRELLRQNLPVDDYEIIVVNDGGASPAALVNSLNGRLNVRLIERENAGPAAARNAGAAVARGSMIAFTDDDCLPHASWLSQLLLAARRAPDHLIGGAIDNALPDDLYATTTQLIVRSAYEYHERNAPTERLFCTSNLLVPADEFRRLGGFSEEFPVAAGEDYDLCARWQRAGLPSRYAPEAIVRHAHPLALGSFCRQHFNYGRGLLRSRERSARAAGGRLRLGAPRFYLDLVTYPMRQGLGAQGVLLSGLVVLSQGATALGAVVEKMSPSPPKRGSGAAQPPGST